MGGSESSNSSDSRFQISMHWASVESVYVYMCLEDLLYKINNKYIR